MKPRKPDNQKQQNLEAERDWHRTGFYIDSGHWTSHPLFASRQRHWLHNEVQSIRFYGALCQYIKRNPPRNGNAQRALFAPVGNGKDAVYLQGDRNIREIHGIDISPACLAACPKYIITKEADILCSGYADRFFELIVCSQFLHHVHAVGFEPFLEEFYRMMQAGGTLAILEPSNLYPFGWLTELARKVMGNVTGLVEGEHPISPYTLTATLKQIGFENIRVQGLLFTHVRFPSFVQHLIDAVDYPFRIFPPFRSFANSTGWFCQKP